MKLCKIYIHNYQMLRYWKGCFIGRLCCKNCLKLKHTKLTLDEMINEISDKI